MTEKPVAAPPETEEAAEEPKIKINRREFLNLAWLASLGILSIDLGIVTYFFAMPRFREGEFGGTFTVGGAGELPEAGSSPDENPRGKFWLANTAAGVLALYKVCTHLGCLYGWIEEEGIFRCPCHGSQFEQNGDFKLGPAPRNLDRFVVQLVNETTGEVLAETDLETGAPLPVPDDPNIVLRVDTGNLVRGLPK
jgi:cytochrome b6-f complex iron-sulfur subunit